MNRRGVALSIGMLAWGATGGAVVSAHGGAMRSAMRIAARSVARPPVRAIFSYQIGGPFEASPAVEIVDRDRSAPPVLGRYNICYVNAFQAQPGELGWWRARHRSLLAVRDGHALVDRGWREQLLDTSTATKRRALLGVIGRWIDGCARAGYQAVEPDNLDSWTRSQGALSREDNLALARLLIARAHARGLAIAQKNAVEIAPVGRRLGFDFAIAEECQPYRECNDYLRAYGREVIEIEYPDDGGPRNFAAACRLRSDQISIVYRDRNVTPAGDRGYLEQTCAQAGLR
jgi:hypothetical protein